MFSLTSVKSSAMMQSLHFAISLFATFVFNFGFACSIEITNMEDILNLKFLTIANDLKNISQNTLVCSIKTKFCLGEWAGADCLGWPEFSRSNLTALFNQIQGVH